MSFMNLTHHLAIRSSVLKGHVNKYAMLGLIISISSILFASLFVSYQITGMISIAGFIAAQTSNPAIWALDLTPFMFAYWGQSFCYELANKAELIIEDQTKELVNKSGDLESKLQHESNHDYLTNLPNQRLLSQRIMQALKQRNKDEELALIILNIKDFKTINYDFGSFSANSLLMQFTEKLKTILLEPYMLQAYMGMNMIARLQGAEFAILLPRVRKEHQLEEILTQLIEDTSVTFMIDGTSINIATTAGVALYPQHGTTDEALIHHATLCLLHTEKEGKAYAFYDARMDVQYKSKRIMLKEINQSVDNQEIDVLYQPTMALDSEKTIGAEAVICFNHPNYGQLSADKLIPLVEGTSVDKKLTYLVLKTAIKQLALWHQTNHKIYMIINLYNAADMELPGFIAQLLKENNLSADYLRIELTEKACLSDQKHTMTVLTQLADLGIKIAISDFGSGYSSFVYLTNFPISVLKIDKAFVMNMMKDEKKLSIVRAIIKLAAAMNLVVFADGITDQAILTELKQLGCLYGQGSYFSDALNASDFNALLT